MTKIGSFLRKIFGRPVGLGENRADDKGEDLGAVLEETEYRITQLDNEIKKNLWGVDQDKHKIGKLADLAIEKLEKIIALKKKEADGEDASLEQEALSSSAEIDRLGEDLERFRALVRLLGPEEMAGAGVEPLPACSDERRGPSERVKVLDKPRILVVDDELLVVKAVRYFLTKRGCEVLSSPKPAEGLKKALEERPDLILLDVIMPGMNGYEFLSRLRADARVSHIPVILLSALSRESDILEGLAKGAADYLTKPFSPEILYSKIRKILAAQNGHSPHHRPQ
jgi:CheY-like chemotaxis protein